jgi:hypothetical protein
MCRLSCRRLDYLHDWQKKMEEVIDVFLITKGNVQFLDVFCIFQCQQNKGFSHFLDTDSKLMVYRDGVVHPSRKDNILLPVVFDEFSAMP